MANDATDKHVSHVARAGRRTHDRMVGLTLKTALAAGIAWKLGVLLPAYLPTYSYYAPLGALTVMYSAVYDSAVEGLRALAAVSIGVLVSVLLQLVAAPDAVTVALAIGVGMLLGNLRQLGDQGSWAPMAALFVFTVGQTDTLKYVSGYVSQLALGAVVGFVVNAIVFPPLGLHDVERSTRAVRRDIVGLLRDVQRLLEADDEDRDKRAVNVSEDVGALPDTRHQLRGAVAQAQRAQRGNPRRRRWQESRADVMALADASENAAVVAEDLARELLEQHEMLERSQTEGLGAAAGAIADVIARSRAGVPDHELVERAQALLDEAVPENAPFLLEGTASGLRRCLSTLTGWTDRADSL